MTEDKVRENRVRRMASRQGLQLLKSRRRDPRALDFGRYWLKDLERNAAIGNGRALTLDEIEAWLTRD